MREQSREIIDRFAGPYAFLSNFHPCRVTFYTSEGCISYCGEEGDYWRHILIGGKWTEQSGHICYGEVYPAFARTHHNMESLIEEIRRQVIHDDRRYEDKARALLKAFEEHDPDGVLCALSGRGLHENGVAAGIWPDGEIWNWISMTMGGTSMNMRCRMTLGVFSRLWYRPSVSICAGSSTISCLTCMPRAMRK